MPSALFALGIAAGTALGTLRAACGERHPTAAIFGVEAGLLPVAGLGVAVVQDPRHQHELAATRRQPSRSG